MKIQRTLVREIRENTLAAAEVAFSKDRDTCLSKLTEFCHSSFEDLSGSQFNPDPVPGF